MDAKKFYNTVKEMRRMQKLYYKHRHHSMLKRSKELEAEIDAEIERVEKITNKQQLNLF